jgi:hypothetical protein
MKTVRTLANDMESEVHFAIGKNNQVEKLKCEAMSAAMER